jgi:hypothetical protein
MLKPTDTVEKRRETFASGADVISDKALLQAELSKSKIKSKKMEICAEPSKSDTEIHSSPIRELEILLEFVEEQEDEKY